MSGEPRAANVAAVERTQVLSLARDDFAALLGDLATVLELNKLAVTMESVPILKRLTPDARASVLRRVAFRDYPRGQTVVRQGERGDVFYIVVEGCVDVIVSGSGKVATLGPGEFFGEAALLASAEAAEEEAAEAEEDAKAAKAAASGGGGGGAAATAAAVRQRAKSKSAAAAARKKRRAEPPVRNASVVASQEAVPGSPSRLKAEGLTRLGELSKEVFDTHMRQLSSVESAHGTRKGELAQVAEDAANEVRFSDLEPLRTLGVGTFGVVRMVRHVPRAGSGQSQRGKSHSAGQSSSRQSGGGGGGGGGRNGSGRNSGQGGQGHNRPGASGAVYALKIMHKITVNQLGQRRNILGEREALLRMNGHPFVPRLAAVYKDEHNLYLLQEICQVRFR